MTTRAQLVFAFNKMRHFYLERIIHMLLEI